MKKIKSLLFLLIIAYVFGILNFHYNETVSPLFSKIFGESESLILLPLVLIYWLLPWYLLSLFVYFRSKKEDIYNFKLLCLKTIYVYLVSILAHYLHYVFLLFFIGLPNFESVKFNFSAKNIEYAFRQLFIPGIMEWGTGAIILGFLISLFNYFAIPLVKKCYHNLKERT